MGDLLKQFRKANGLTQDQLASYLGGGVAKGFISQIEHGSRKLPAIHLAKLLNNPFGWDTSMLQESGTQVVANAQNNSRASVNISSGGEKNLLAEIESLKKQLAEEKERSRGYWELIQRLTK